VVLRSADENQLLANADFERGFSHWLPSAQGWYVPWHIDNLYLELLIERGIAGATLVLGALGWALHRMLASARRNPIAPFLAASLAGALCLGLVSSILDVPRVAFLLGLIAVLGYELSDSRRRAA
jgi:O-antigen ligase